MHEECVVAIYDSFAKAEQALHILSRSGFAMWRVSLATAATAGGSKLVADLRMGDDALRDGAIGAGLGGAVGLLAGLGATLVTGVGVVFLFGPAAAGILGATVGAYLGTFFGWGVHRGHIKQYEQFIKEGKVLVVANGAPLELAQAEKILKETDVLAVDLHARAADESPEVHRR
jgi:hypothetical protein